MHSVPGTAFLNDALGLATTCLCLKKTNGKYSKAAPPPVLRPLSQARFPNPVKMPVVYICATTTLQLLTKKSDCLIAAFPATLTKKLKGAEQECLEWLLHGKKTTVSAKDLSSTSVNIAFI